MARVSGLWRRYRIPAVALVISATLHAAVMVGLPGRNGAVDDRPEPEYLATLDPSAPPAAAIEPAARPAPKPRPSMPRRARREAPPVVAMASDALDSALPVDDYVPEAPSSEELAAPPEAALPPPPEQLAMAQPATPVPALEAPKFPVSALPARL